MLRRDGDSHPAAASRPLQRRRQRPHAAELVIKADQPNIDIFESLPRHIAHATLTYRQFCSPDGADGLDLEPRTRSIVFAREATPRRRRRTGWPRWDLRSCSTDEPVSTGRRAARAGIARDAGSRLRPATGPNAVKPSSDLAIMSKNAARLKNAEREGSEHHRGSGGSLSLRSNNPIDAMVVGRPVP